MTIKGYWNDEGEKARKWALRPKTRAERVARMAARKAQREARKKAK